MSLTKKVTRDRSRGTELAKAVKRQFNLLHAIDHFDDYRIEKLLLQQKEHEVALIKDRFVVPNDYPKFSPSGANKCKRELFYKINRMKYDDSVKHPYQNRWTKNATGVHEQRQRDWLYSEKHLTNPPFLVERMPDGLPAWEKNVQKYKLFEHNGQKFYIFGMMDGQIRYQKDGTLVGWEFKTKSTKPDKIEKIKGPDPSHKKQLIGYSILYGIDEFVIMYESVAKDEWRAGQFAMQDIQTFYVKVTEEQRQELLDKYAEIAEAVETGAIPDQETSKCMFCPFKSTCLLGGN